MASKPVEFRPEARSELLEASDYYRERSPVAADRFEDAVTALIRRIGQHPEQFGIVEDPIRLALVPRFPFYVPFRVLPSKIEILGMCHAARRPGYWRDRA